MQLSIQEWDLNHCLKGNNKIILQYCMSHSGSGKAKENYGSLVIDVMEKSIIAEKLWESFPLLSLSISKLAFFGVKISTNKHFPKLIFSRIFTYEKYIK